MNALRLLYCSVSPTCRWSKGGKNAQMLRRENHVQNLDIQKILNVSVIHTLETRRRVMQNSKLWREIWIRRLIRSISSKLPIPEPASSFLTVPQHTGCASLQCLCSPQPHLHWGSQAHLPALLSLQVPHAQLANSRASGSLSRAQLRRMILLQKRYRCALFVMEDGILGWGGRLLQGNHMHPWDSLQGIRG